MAFDAKGGVIQGEKEDKEQGKTRNKEDWTQGEKKSRYEAGGEQEDIILKNG